MPSSVVGNTFRAIELEPQATAELEFSKFVEALFQTLRLTKEERFVYYESLRKKNTKWANGSRWVLALLGSIAFLLTGLAAALRFAPEAFLQKWDLAGFDKGVLLAVLAIYAVMGAISFYEKGTDKTSSYFRHLGIILAIRDLWTKVQFEFLKELTVLKSAADPKTAETVARERIRALAEAFCNDLNKVATGELTEWRTEFLASLSELESAAKKGSEDVTKQIQEALQAAERAATDAKAAAEKAAGDAKAAAKTAEEAAKPGAINLTLSGDFDDQVLISVDGIEVARSRGKAIALERLVPGLRKISAHAKRDAKDVETALMVDVKPGLQELQLVLS
jgi:AcrR family transcriptional regulator